MRINVNLSDELNSKAEFYAKKFGVSKSQFCSMMIGQGIMSYDKANDMMSDCATVIQEQLKIAIDTVNKK